MAKRAFVFANLVIVGQLLILNSLNAQGQHTNAYPINMTATDGEKWEGGEIVFELPFSKETSYNCAEGQCELSDCVLKSPEDDFISLGPVSNVSSRFLYNDQDLKPLPNPQTDIVSWRLKQGVCSVKITNLQLEDDGIWTLRATHKASGQVYDRRLLLAVRLNATATVEPQRIQAGLKESATFVVKISGYKQKSLSACEVKSPNGTWYTLGMHTSSPMENIGLSFNNSDDDEEFNRHKNTNPKNIVVYAGGSFKKGNCGVKIKAISPEHFGTWIFKAYTKRVPYEILTAESELIKKGA